MILTPSRSVPVADIALAVLFAACPLLEASLIVDDGFTWWYLAAVVIQVVIVAAIAWRRIHPVASFLVTAVGFIAYGTLFTVSPVNLGVSPILLAAPLSLWAVTRWAPSTAWGTAGLVLALAGSLVNPAVLGAPNLADSPVTSTDRVLLFGVPAVLVTGVAYAWAAHLRAGEERLTARAAAQLQDQRAELSRELHDVVGHGLTAITVRAQTALHLDDRRGALEEIRDTAAESLADVRALVDALADGTVSADPATVNAVVARAGGGVRVRGLTPEEVSTAARWPLSIRLALVRCAQETTTNLVKHGDGTGSLAVRVRPDHFTVESRNPARRGERGVDPSRAHPGEPATVSPATASPTPAGPAATR
ncbi:two-component sensor histidine kinase, partial [Corynebacterium bovis]